MVTVGVKRMLPQAFAKMLSCFGCHRCCRFVVKRFVVMMMMMTTTVSEILVKIMMAMIMVVILIAKSMWLPRLWLMRRTLKVSISNMPLPSVWKTVSRDPNIFLGASLSAKPIYDVKNCTLDSECFAFKKRYRLNYQNWLPSSLFHHREDDNSFIKILDNATSGRIPHLIYISSSSSVFPLNFLVLIKISYRYEKNSSMKTIPIKSLVLMKISYRYDKIAQWKPFQ